MESFNAICGLPRSGSTLLANILNQRPGFYAGSTSALGRSVAMISAFLSSQPETRSDLACDQRSTELYLESMLRGLITGRYSQRKEHTIFDKDRSWSAIAQQLLHLYPSATMIVCVRDLRAILGSIEMHHARFPLLDETSTPDMRSVDGRAAAFFAPSGIIGGPLGGLQDLLRRAPEQVEIVKFEDLTSDPGKAMAGIYDAMDVDGFAHDFENVDSLATDNDGALLGKFPHQTRPKVEPVDPDGWREFVTSDVEQTIRQRFDWFFRSFDYDQPKAIARRKRNRKRAQLRAIDSTP